jgi:prepilin-type N-terminal cleavage/methylation domain-containing protein
VLREDQINHHGFTIIEIILVISLLGLLAVGAVVFSPSGAPKSFSLDGATKQIQSHIQYAQQHALLHRTTAGVDFVSSGAYTVYQGTTATPLSDPLTKQDLIITLGDVYNGVSLSANYTVEFNKYGEPSVGGAGSVTVTDGTTTNTVTVAATTGRVTY